MIRFENTIDIERSPADVFTYLADLEHASDWNWAITSSEKRTPGPVRVGTQFRQTRSVPQPGVEVIEIVGLEPGRRIEVAGRLGPFAARLSYELTATVAGTRLANRVELEPPVPLGPLRGVLGGRIRASVAENLDVLRRLLEDQRLVSVPSA